MTHRISTEIFDWIDEALDAHSDGADVRFDGQFGLTQDGPFIALYFSLPGAILGTEVRVTVQLVDLSSADADAVSRVVRDTIEALHQSRSAQLAEANGHGHSH